MSLPKLTRNQLVVLIALAIVFLTAAMVLLFLVSKSDAPAPEKQNDQQAQTEELPKTSITMLATGDWIAHDAINAAALSGGSYDYSSMTEGFKGLFAESEVNFCNLATPAGGEQFGVSGYPVFNAPTEWLDGMNGLGCNLYNTGTNHTNDKGQAVISTELDYLDDVPGILAHAGANRSVEEQKEVRYFEVEGVKFAFVSYSTYSNSPNPNSYSLNRFAEPLVTNQMTEARENADIVVASMRWGTEYSETINAAQATQSQKLADLGADIVLGHGTHTLQPIKKLKGKDGRETIVWYGLGNFLNAQLETVALTGCVAQFDIDIATKKVTSSMCLPFYQHYEWTAEEKAREDLMARHNFKIVPLYNAQELMSDSQLDTTVENQMERIRAMVNQFTEMSVINAEDL